jgi:hypothetical protein
LCTSFLHCPLNHCRVYTSLVDLGILDNASVLCTKCHLCKWISCPSMEEGRCSKPLVFNVILDPQKIINYLLKSSLEWTSESTKESSNGWLLMCPPPQFKI